MVSHLFFYQLMFLGLLWLCAMLHYAWTNEYTGGDQRPSKPLPPPRKRSSEPKPFPGLTRKPPCAACEQAHAYTLQVSRLSQFLFAPCQLTPTLAAARAHPRQWLDQALAAPDASDGRGAGRPCVDPARGAALSRAAVATASRGVSMPRWWAAVRGGGLSGRRVSAWPASRPSPGGRGPLGGHESPLVYAFLSL